MLFKIVGFTTQQFTFSTETKIETKSQKNPKELFRRNSDVLHLQWKLFSVASRISTKQEASTYRRILGHLLPVENSKAYLLWSRHKNIFNLQDHEKQLILDSIQNQSRSTTVTTRLPQKKNVRSSVDPSISTCFWPFIQYIVLSLRPRPFLSIWVGN